nr:PREDICTED: protein DBF4 homolog B [Latimeria chalumnae]|eukprot:XP_014346364.1 PREDICTED: protein DBF4 homolog B [Latimeria chalumnae]
MHQRSLLKEFEGRAIPAKWSFLGKAFYLDLPNNKQTQTLAERIKKLGGTIESFLSKEVSYMVSNNKEMIAGSGHVKHTAKLNRKHSGDVLASTSHSTSPKESQVGIQQRPMENLQISRGKKLLEKAIKNVECVGSSTISANAHSWGVKIMHIDDFLPYLERKMLDGSRKKNPCLRKTEGKGPFSPISVLPRVGKLKSPFIKIEDTKRQYKPFHQQFESFPELNYIAAKGYSPFEPLKSPQSSNKNQEKEKSKDLDWRLENTEEDGGRKSTKPVTAGAGKKKKGYCECCHQTFSDLNTHLQSEQHRQFALDASHYTHVDSIIFQLASGFLELHAGRCVSSSCSPPATPLLDHFSLNVLYDDSNQKIIEDLIALSSTPGNGESQFSVQDCKNNFRTPDHRLELFIKEPLNKPVEESKGAVGCTGNALLPANHREETMSDGALKSLKQNLTIAVHDGTGKVGETFVKGEIEYEQWSRGEQNYDASVLESEEACSNFQDFPDNRVQPKVVTVSLPSFEVPCIQESWNARGNDLNDTALLCNTWKHKRSNSESPQCEKKPRLELDSDSSTTCHGVSQCQDTIFGFNPCRLEEKKNMSLQEAECLSQQVPFSEKEQYIGFSQIHGISDIDVPNIGCSFFDQLQHLGRLQEDQNNLVPIDHEKPRKLLAILENQDSWTTESPAFCHAKTRL